MQQQYTSPSKNGTADNTLNLDNSKMEGYAASSEQEKSLSFIEECEEVAAVLTRYEREVELRRASAGASSSTQPSHLDNDER